eukprot:Sro339_g120960.2  (169) ;mRNA; f:6548-7054
MANAGQIVGEIQYCDPSRATFTVVSAKLEAKIASLADEKAQREYLVGMGVDLDDKAPLDDLMSYSVLPSMVKDLLNLFLVYTGPGVPPERSRTTKAYLFSKHQPPNCVQLAGRLHGDIQKGFIRAEVVPASVLLQYSNYNEARAGGAIRTEGKDSTLNEDDVVMIKWR